MWAESSLGDYVRVEHGFAFKGEYFSEAGKYVVLTPGNFHEAGGFRARPGKDRFYGATFPDRYLLSKGDLIVAMTEQGEGLLGSASLIPESSMYLHNQRLGLVKEKSQVADRRFLYYLFNTDAVRQQIRNSSSGAKVRHTSPERIYGVKVRVPPKVAQQKIAAILSAYDDLIENNKRRIALLEKMAEEIYREWFVRLRFPGHENVKKVKGVPERWGVLPFSEIVNINPSERIDKSEEVPFVGMEDLSLSSMFFAVKKHRKNATGSKFRNRDVLFPRITPSVENGKRGVVMTLADGRVGCGSTEFIVMREKVIGPEHIYFLTCSPEFRKHAELSMTGASGRQRVQEDCFSFFLVKTPPDDVRLQFSEVIGPHFAQIQLLSLQNESLMKSRDMLLPRLISGKLSVENLDIQFPPSMEDCP